MRRLAVVCGLVMLVLVGCSGEIAVSELGRDCSGVGDRFNPAYYFGAVSRVEKVPSADLAEATRTAETFDGSADIISILSGTGETVHDDGTGGLPSALWLGPSDRGEVARLPAGEMVLLAIHAAAAAIPGEAWVEFVAIPTGEGELAFAGECADSFFRRSLAAYRDSAHPGETLESVFMEVIADDAEWSRFNRFETGE